MDFSEVFKILGVIQEGKANLIGHIGESVFNQYAQEHLTDEYYILSDIVLKSNNGTTQIDQIIISKFGIFVVEVKTYKGWIFGDENSPQWTQALTSGKYKFQNPLRQNYKHIKALQELLGYNSNIFKSLIAFSATAEFKTKLPNNVIVGGNDYINFIKGHKTVLLSENVIITTIETIIANKLTSEEHKNHIKKTQEQYNNPDENNAPDCPRCANKMILRKSKAENNNGNLFWGCSRYPQCKSIVNIKNNKSALSEQSVELEKIFNTLFSFKL
jgi:hypothetical protein